MTSLFARDVQVAVLASGSRGNCTYVGDGYGGVLIDCGISTRQIFKRLAEAGLSDARIDAVLITHEHADHSGAARILCNQLRKRQGSSVPFFMTRGTHQQLRDNLRPDAYEPIDAGRPFSVRHYRVDPFRVPHDVPDPVAYRVRVGGTWVGVVTDLGRPTTLVMAKLRTMNVAVLEFNHDVEMLRHGPYPWSLKQRVRSSHGHLSNHQAAELLEGSLSDNLEHVVLAHLSQDNNRPELAVAAAKGVLSRAGLDVAVTVAQQGAPIAPIRTRAHDW